MEGHYDPHFTHEKSGVYLFSESLMNKYYINARFQTQIYLQSLNTHTQTYTHTPLISVLLETHAGPFLPASGCQFKHNICIYKPPGGSLPSFVIPTKSALLDPTVFHLAQLSSETQ